MVLPVELRLKVILWGRYVAFPLQGGPSEMVLLQCKRSLPGGPLMSAPPLVLYLLSRPFMCLVIHETQMREYG